MRPLFSVIVPIYGVEAYLEKCIQSLIEQDYDDFEVILVDDGSPDRCPLICDSYASRYPNITVIHKNNGGLVSARKIGVNMAKGYYILNVDGDDYVKPHLLYNLSRIIKAYNPDVISFDYEFVDENNEFISEHHDMLSDGMLDRCALLSILEHAIYDEEQKDHNTGCITYNIWSKAIKREIIIKTQNSVPDNIRMGEDLAVVIPALENTQSLYISSVSEYAYRQRKNSMVKSFNYSEDQNIISLIEFLSTNLSIVRKNNINCYAVRMGLGQLIKAARQIDNYPRFKQYADDFYRRKYREWLNNFCHNNLWFKRRIRLWIIKKKLWFIFWLFYSHK